jgi:Ca2+-binding RTX toxin-like protein
VQAGTGDHQLLVGGDGSDTLHGGDGAYDTLMGGNGQDAMYAGTGAHQLLIGGNGSDVFYSGVSGDTMQGSGGSDVFHMTGHHVSDTIDGGGGSDTVQFDAYSSHDVASLHTSHGETTIKFADGQTTTVSHVENLVFTDKTEHLP